MKNQITKNLIILGAIIFTFAFTGIASAEQCYGYNCNNNNYYDPYNSSNWSTPVYSGSNQARYQPPFNTNPYNPNPYYIYQGSPQSTYYYQPTQPQPQPQPQYQPVVVTSPQPNNSTVNNYYYQTVPATPKVATTTVVTSPIPVPKTTTNTTNTTTNYTNGVDENGNPYNNSLGASAYNGYSYPNGNGITALSLGGSGSFMPSSIWQWILVIILILAIIVIARMFIRKQTVTQESHTTTHSH